MRSEVSMTVSSIEEVKQVMDKVAFMFEGKSQIHFSLYGHSELVNKEVAPNLSVAGETPAPKKKAATKKEEKKEEVVVEAEPVAEEPTSAEAEEPTSVEEVATATEEETKTEEDLMKAAKACSQKHGLEALKAILKDHGYKTVKEVKAEDRAKLIEEMK